jgi:fluoroacetyl-CoA thioesterase
MLAQKLEVGLTFKNDYLIKEEHTAMHIGPGDIEVLSTPSMIGFMENAAMECVKPELTQGQTTVGSAINIKHLGPVPTGEKLTVTAQLIDIDKKRLTFKVRAEWRNEVIGDGRQERFIVNREKFLQKLQEKARIQLAS